MVLVRFEPLNPLTPDPDFGNLFCVYWRGNFLRSPSVAAALLAARMLEIFKEEVN